MILEKIKEVQNRIARAARKAGRSPEEVGLVAVTKYASDEAVRAALASGLIREVAESRVQDAARRKAALGTEAAKVRWRLIGHLQRNKAKQALETFDALDSLDSLQLAAALQKRLAEGSRKLQVLIQVKLSERETQSGLPPEDIGGFLAGLAGFDRLVVSGLMAIAPNLDRPEETRPYFRRMKGLFDANFKPPRSPGDGPYLSMGMSRDFEIAVEEGANLVRVGASIFEP